MTKKINKITVIALSLLPSFFSLSAHALQVPTLRFGLGYASLSFNAGEITSSGTSGGNTIPKQTGTALGSMITLNPMFLWDVSTVRTRVGIQFQADLGSKYGFISTSGVGIVALFYPMGLSSSREVKEDGSIIRKTRTSPYFQAAITPTLFTLSFGPDTPVGSQNNVKADGTSKIPYVAAQVIETSLGVGVDYPINDNLVGFFGLHYRFAAFTSTEKNGGEVSYKGIEALFGIMTDFF